MSDAELAASMNEAIAPRERSVSAMLKRPVTQSQFDMLFSFYYNRGASRGFKAAVAALNVGDVAAAARAISSSSSAESVGHIAERRLREAAVFLKDNAEDAAGRAVTLYVGSSVVGLLLLGSFLAVRKWKKQRHRL